MTKRLCYESYAFNNPTSFCRFAYIAEYFTQDRFKDEIIWFFCNLVEEHMFKYEFILQQIDTRSAIHDSLDDL